MTIRDPLLTTQVERLLFSKAAVQMSASGKFDSLLTAEAV